MNRSNGMIVFFLIMGFWMMAGQRWVGGILGWVVMFVVITNVVNWFNNQQQEKQRPDEDYDSGYKPKSEARPRVYEDPTEYIETIDGERLEIIDDAGPDRLRLR